MVNYFGKAKWQSGNRNETALNTTVARNLTITDAQRDAYGPFLYFQFSNNSDETIEIHLDGVALGDNTVVNAKIIERVKPKSSIEFGPHENGTPDFVFERIAIKNIAATNTSNDELSWSLRNW